MELVKKIKEINIENEEFIMAFDMKSIAIYKDLTGRFFSRGVSELFKENDEEIIYFIASTLRRKETPNIPLGKEVLEGDILFFVMNLKIMAIELVMMSLPTETSKKK